MEFLQEKNTFFFKKNQIYINFNYLAKIYLDFSRILYPLQIQR